MSDPKPQSLSNRQSTGTQHTLAVLPLAGYCLLLYSLFNLLASPESGLSIGPELFINRVNQLLSLFPIFLVGSAFVFSNQRRNARKKSYTSLQRPALWFVLILAIVYLGCIPVSFLSRHAMVSRDASILEDTSSDLEQRKAKILSSVAQAQSVNSIVTSLSQFPEVRSMRITTDESVEDVRKALSSGLDEAIRLRIENLKREQSSRREQFASSVRTSTIGTLIASGSFFILFLNLMPELTNNFSRVLSKYNPSKGSRRRSTSQRSQLVQKIYKLFRLF